MKKMLILVALLLLPVAYAQLDWGITDFRCGNRVLDQFELCEKGVNVSYCENLSTILKVDTVCDTAHCTCLPRVNMAYCGNNIREGVELCDGTGENKCPEFGVAINISLTCNPKTCGCNLNETVPNEYNPAVLDKYSNLSSSSSVCGDKKVERDEDCDPPNTLCMKSTQDTGICNDKCRCVPPELLGVEEKPVEKVVQNVTENVSANVTQNVTVEVVNVTVPENVTKAPEGPGFFSRLWTWFVALFS
ncbi:MAG: hypothetical protein NTW67_06035 [Candidatus Woesearchaeota archaeon]|nr:hypothetical protein [Candidatus Woesearchaeota archaeon]